MKPELLLTWTARIWGIASALLLIAFAFGGREHLRFTAEEAIGFLLFPVGVVAGFAIAWRRELTGGIVTVACLALFGIYQDFRTGRLPGVWFLVFAAPGFLHIAAALLVRRRRRQVADSRAADSVR